ncbi:MAG TPA: endo-1,4-beta-xylanase, partial [Mycobacterium sp.]|nr:endo-1,4-beta-xylanase [Mycobacterium sp.]
MVLLLVSLSACQADPGDARSEANVSRTAKIAASVSPEDTSTLTRTETFTQTATGTSTSVITVPTTVVKTVTGTVTTTSTSTQTLTQTSTLTLTGTATTPITVTTTQTATGTVTGSKTQTTVLTSYQNFSLTGTITSTNTATVYYATWPHRLGTTATVTTTGVILGTASKTLTGTVTNTMNRTETKTASTTVRGSGTTTGTQTVTAHATMTTTNTNAGTGSRTVTATGTASGTATQTFTYHPTMVVTNTVTNTTTKTQPGIGTTTTSSTTTATSTYSQSRTSTASNTSTSTTTATGTGTSIQTNTIIVTQTATSTLIVCGATGQTCQPSEYCDIDLGTCHASDAVGVCRPVPATCSDTQDTVCGCDGTTYDNPCRAAVKSVSIDYVGACDNSAPTVSLTVSAALFTAEGTLTLTAAASDDLAVAKVELFQDGVLIATLTQPPYTFAVPVTSALDGRHRFAATAYDTRNHTTSDSKRIFVAIGNRFFGTAVTTAADYTNLLAHFNQVTPGNAGKWGVVQPTQATWNFTDLDTAYQFAKDHNIPFKLHTLVWGQQQPSWISSLPADQQLAAVDAWMSALAARYPDVALIDVVNEPMHAPPPYAAALGGAGATGWDWVVKAFQMARAHFPNAELLLNEYFVLPAASFTASFVQIVNVLAAQDLIDGIGEQGHFYERTPDISVISANLTTLAATGLPIYISELDVNLADDARQANKMADLFTTFWSNPSVVGITHWGYLQGAMWQPDAYLIRNDGSLRPALTFIECYKAGGSNCTPPVYVPQPRMGDASGITLEAEDLDTFQNLLATGNVVAYATDGSSFGFSKVVLDANWNTLSVAYALGGGNAITLSVHLGSLANAPIAIVPLPVTGDWSTMK